MTTDVPLRARALVVASVVRVALVWAVPFVALATSPWLLGSVGDLTVPRVVAALVVPPVAVVALCLGFPHGRFGSWAVRRIRRSGGRTRARTADLAAQLALATGTWDEHEVVLVPSPVPNVAALPGVERTTVVATTGAEELLPRDQLEALLATQIVVASDRWVRLATATQLLDAPRFALLFGAGFLNPFLIPLAFLAFLGHRRGDAVRDMLADAAALAATRHPEALARALYALRPAAPHASALWVGLPGFLVDQYWVLSTRAHSTTTVSVGTRQRRWTTVDEIAAELAMRSDRIHRAARGDRSGLFDLGAWKRAVRALGGQATSPTGLPLALTADELAVAERIAARRAAPAG